ncbi:hypothetical protein [Gemmata sp.]|uniref:hypothetical protein n=1 Tax=Gemmata sp. TaxID=1914242 RepID=UPI003F71ABC1
MTEAKFSHSYTSDPGKMNNAWTGTMTGEYLLARGTKPSAAVKAFSATVKDRLKELAALGRAALIVPWHFGAEDAQVYGQQRAVVLRQVYRVTTKLENILNRGGLWRPLPKEATSAPAVWLASMAAAGVGIPRGRAMLAFTPGTDDAIVDLCRAAQPKGPGNVSRNIDPAAANLIDFMLATFLFGGTGSPSGEPPLPPPDASWLSYDAAIAVEGDDGIVEAKTLPGSASEVIGSGGTGELPPSIWGVITTGNLPAGTGKEPGPLSPSYSGGTGVQRRTSSTLYLRLTGRAMRVGFPIPVPALAAVNGITPTLLSRVDAGEGFTQSTVGNVLVPVYAAKWNLRYVLNDENALKGPVPVPVNPMHTP